MVKLFFKIYYQALLKEVTVGYMAVAGELVNFCFCSLAPSNSILQSEV